MLELHHLISRPWCSGGRGVPSPVHRGGRDSVILSSGNSTKTMRLASDPASSPCYPSWLLSVVSQRAPELRA